MNLSIFFEPLNEDIFAALNKPRTLGAYINRFVSKFPDWRAADIAIIGINETRGSGNEENTEPMLMQSENNYTEAQVISREFSRVLEHSLEQMPLIYRTVFILREIEGFNVAETADILNITPINVKVRLNRARAILQKKMEQFYSAADIYEFNLVYCDVVVQHVFKKIDLL